MFTFISRLLKYHITFGEGLMIVANVASHLPKCSLVISREITGENGLICAVNVLWPSAEGLTVLDTTDFLVKDLGPF